MHDSQKFDPPTDATLSKLLAVDAELAAQVAALSAQLENVQEKRRSLQTVIAMFTPTTSTAVLEEQQPQTATAEINGQLEPALEVSVEPLSVAPPAALNGEVTTGSSPEPDEEPQPSGSKRRSSRASKAKTVKPTSRPKGWQHYLLPEFAKLSLPEAVSVVLQGQGDEVFDVSTILDALFVDDMPQAARSEARNRITNVLSIGLKQNKWYRAKKGQYSLSREAAELNAAA
ncbi:MAG TPA: hypothetical protein V6D03_02875 [Candidatus Caenarcaniphilales bacterium]